MITFPSNITKNKLAHPWPAGPLTQSLLPQRKGLLFPGRGTDTPIDGWSKSKTALDRVLGTDVAYWQLRDLRRTYRTIHASIGTAPHLAERLVNHISSQSEVEKIYDRHKYLPEMRAAQERFEFHLQKELGVT